MPLLSSGRISVSVPATSANLGPGFDSLGLALGLRDTVEVQVGGSELRITVDGVGRDDLPRDEKHLVYVAMMAALTQMGAHADGVHLHCRNVIPHSRGLGSSSAAIVAGVVAARALVEGGADLLDDQAAFAVAAELEGHPDNVAPALLGGFTIACPRPGGWVAVPAEIHPDIATVVFFPDEPVHTAVARGILPVSVSHRRAAANAGCAALLVAALRQRPDLLLVATQDRLHQEFREQAMPDSLALMRTLRSEGVPAVISGAGPAVLAFVSASDRDEVAGRVPGGWNVLQLPVDRRGALVLREEEP